MTIEQQIFSGLAMFISSIAIGGIFDGYRVAKDKITLSKWLVFIIDIGFGISSAFLTFYLLLWANNGQLRIAIFLFFLAGIWIYYLFLSRYMIIFWTYLLKVIYNVWKAIIKLFNVFILTPIKFVYQFLFSLILVIIGGISSIINYLLSIIVGIYKRIVKKIAKNDKSKNENRKKEGFLQKLKNFFNRKRN